MSASIILKGIRVNRGGEDKKKGKEESDQRCLHTWQFVAAWVVVCLRQQERLGARRGELWRRDAMK